MLPLPLLVRLYHRSHSSAPWCETRPPDCCRLSETQTATKCGTAEKWQQAAPYRYTACRGQYKRWHQHNTTLLVCIVVRPFFTFSWLFSRLSSSLSTHCLPWGSSSTGAPMIGAFRPISDSSCVEAASWMVNTTNTNNKQIKVWLKLLSVY